MNDTLPEPLTELVALSPERDLSVLEIIVEQTADAVLVTDRAGRIEYVNPAWQRLTGYTRQEAVGQTPRLLKSGIYGPAFYSHLWQTISAGNSFQAVFVNRKKSGELYHEDLVITPLRDPQGVIRHFVSTGRDISERMKIQERVTHLASIPELDPNPILEFTGSGRLLYWNPAAKQLFQEIEADGDPRALRIRCTGYAAALQTREVLVEDISVGARLFKVHVFSPHSDNFLRCYLNEITDRKKSSKTKA